MARVGTCIVICSALAACGRVSFEPVVDNVPPNPAAHCPPLPPATGLIYRVTPAIGTGLAPLVASAPPGATFLLADGLYQPKASLAVTANNVTIRSESGKLGGVVIDGEYAFTIISVQASHVTIADLVLSHGRDAVEVTSVGGETYDTSIYRIRAENFLERGIVMSATQGTLHPDGGTIACSTIEITSDFRDDPRMSCPILTGVLGVAVDRWAVRDNTITGLVCSSGAGIGIQFHTRSHAVIVERNRVRETWLGIRLGLRDTPLTPPRVYTDDPCVGSYRDHVSGVVRNNLVRRSATVPSIDAGIAAWAACDVTIVHNTLIDPPNGFSSVEWRYPATDQLRVLNNLASQPMRQRDPPTALDRRGNLEDPAAIQYVDEDAALLDGTPPIDMGVTVANALCTDDIDGDPRLDPRDVGADER